MHCGAAAFLAHCAAIDFFAWKSAEGETLEQATAYVEDDELVEMTPSPSACAPARPQRPQEGQPPEGRGVVRFATIRDGHPRRHCRAHMRNVRFAEIGCASWVCVTTYHRYARA